MHAPHNDAVLPDTATLGELLRAPLVEPPRPSRGDTAAAVLILLFDRDDHPHLILTKRTDHLSHHPGQISLPGGRFDPQDGSLAQTALRETWEEIGVSPHSVELVRQLPQVNTRVSGFVVTPYVGVAVQPVVPVVSDHEIARVMEVPLAQVLAADALLPPFPTVATLRYALDGEDVWGATARILADFTRVIRAAVSRR